MAHISLSVDVQKLASHMHEVFDQFLNIVLISDPLCTCLGLRSP